MAKTLVNRSSKVTHDAVAASYANRVVFLADGQVVSEVHDPTPESVLRAIRGFDD